MRKILAVLFFFVLPLHAADVKEFVLAPQQGTLWSVAASLTLEPESEKVLAVWQKHPGTHSGRTIWGRLISPAGKPAGAPFPIVNNDSTFSPQVAYNPFSKEFLLVYSRDRGDLHLEIYAQRLNLRGRKKGGFVRLSPASDLNLNVQNDRPTVTVSPVDGSYFLSWQRSGLQNVVIAGEGIIGARFDRNLNPIGAPVLLHPLLRAPGLITGPYVNDVKFHQSGKIILAFDTRNADGTTAKYSTMTIDSQAIAPAPIRVVKSTPTKFLGGASIFIGSADRSFIFFGDTTAMKRRPIGANGEPSGAIGPAFALPARKKRIADPNPVLFDDDVAVLTGTEYPQDTTEDVKIWIQTLTSLGKPSGPAEELKSLPNAAGLFALPLPTANGVRTILLVYSEGLTFGVPSGLILLKVTL